MCAIDFGLTARNTVETDGATGYVAFELVNDFTTDGANDALDSRVVFFLLRGIDDGRGVCFEAVGGLLEEIEAGDQDSVKLVSAGMEGRVNSADIFVKGFEVLLMLVVAAVRRGVK